MTPPTDTPVHAKRTAPDDHPVGPTPIEAGEPVSLSVAAEPTGEPVHVRHSKRYYALLYAGFIVACMLLAAYFSAHYPRISPHDEQAHLDYALKLRHGHLLKVGEYMGQEGLRQSTCRGFDSVYVPPACPPRGTHIDPKTFVWGGINTASGHLPTYYALAAVLSYPVQWLGVDDPVDALRIGAGAWLGIGLATLFIALELWGVPLLMRAAAVTFLAGTPMVMWLGTTLNPEITAIFGGALMVWLAARRAPSLTLLFLVSMVACSGKVSNILAVLAAAWVVARLPDATRKLRLQRVGAMIAGGMSLPVLWAIVQHFRVVRTDESGMAGVHLQPGLFFSSIRQFTPPTQNMGAPWFFTGHEATVALFTWLNLLAVAIAFLLITSAPRGSRLRHLGQGTWPMMILGPLVLMTLIAASAHVLMGIPPRYGMSLTPVMMVGLAAVRWSRPLQLAFASFSLVALVTLLYLVSTSTYTMVGKL